MVENHFTCVHVMYRQQKKQLIILMVVVIIRITVVILIVLWLSCWWSDDKWYEWMAKKMMLFWPQVVMTMAKKFQLWKRLVIFSSAQNKASNNHLWQPQQYHPAVIQLCIISEAGEGGRKTINWIRSSRGGILISNYVPYKNYHHTCALPNVFSMSAENSQLSLL